MTGPKIALILILFLALAMWFLWFHPSMRLVTEISGDSARADLPLAMPGLTAELADYSRAELLPKIRDNWGYIYPPTGEVNLRDTRWSGRERDLNSGIRELRLENLPRAFRYLNGAYNAYMDKVLGSNEGRLDALPESENELLLYGLYRYNRAHGLLKMATSLREGDSKREELLKKAIYDLRRSVGAFETLGDPRGRRAFAPYWGADIKAWEGTALEHDHGALPIHAVYANLSTAYLRIGDAPGYPYVETGYLRGEQKKYAMSNSKLNGVVSLLVEDQLKTRQRNLMKFRLTLALQNLEAAGRGMGRHNEARFNYMIGIILSHLQAVDDSVSYDDAIGFLQLAAQAPIGGDDEDAVHAAKKELALIYLELGNAAKAQTILLETDPDAVRDTIGGPDKAYGLLFTDIAQFGAYARGDLERVLNHLAFRRNEFQTTKTSDRVEQAHQDINQILAKHYFTALRKRLAAQRGQGRVAEVAETLRQLDENQRLAQIPWMAESYRQYCEHPLKGRLLAGAGTRLNLWLKDNPGWRKSLRLLPWVLLAGFFAFPWWFYRSHARVAAKVFRSGYGDELHR